MKRVVLLLISLCLMVSLCCPAFAAQNPPDSPFSSNYFISYGTVLSDQGYHQMHVTFSAVGMGMCDEIGVATYFVEKLVTLIDGTTGWMAVTSVLPGQTAQNVPSHTYGLYFQGVAGETYRVQCTFTCTKTFSDGTTSTEYKPYTSPQLTVH